MELQTIEGGEASIHDVRRAVNALGIEVCAYIDDGKVDEVLDDLRLEDWDIEDNVRHDHSHQLWFTKEVA